MTIADFIRTEIFLPRARSRGILVIYDPDRRYHEICLGLGSEELTVIDASLGSIEAREGAMRALLRPPSPEGKRPDLLMYVPAAAPQTDEQRVLDPFAAYAVAGAVFPGGDGDDYLALCLRAKPDHATEIHKLFETNPNPPFAVIDAIGKGAGWPVLRALLGAESPRDIIFALLVPDQRQAAALKGDDTWIGEVRDLLAATLGLKLKTRGRSLDLVAGELWRFLLFSEFAFDLPVPLPPALADVPHAPDSAKTIVEDLCDRLRGTSRSRSIYVEKAEDIEAELHLAERCTGILNFGERNTFPFAERAHFAGATAALLAEDRDGLRDILGRHRASLWTTKPETEAQWSLIEAASRLIETCEDCDRDSGEAIRSQERLIEFYLGRLREADRHQREFEQAVAEALYSNATASEAIDQAIAKARGRYRRLAEKAQLAFTRHLTAEGWPPAGRLANAAIFDRLVAPLLKERGKRVAYILVDALRYELGVELRQLLAEDASVELLPAFAPLPTITPVGMASLLPGANETLRLIRKDGDAVPMLGESAVATLAQRMEVLRRLFGDRFAEMGLNDFIRAKQEVPAGIELLVLRSVDIDSQLENNPDTTLGLIQDTLKRIRVAVHKLKPQGFHHAVIATDHGFALNAQAEAGDVCTKPGGSWLTIHERSLLGDGREDAHNFAVAAEKLGIRGDFRQFAGPRSMAPYRKGLLYFHGGASLQEAVVPVLSLRLVAKPPSVAKPSVRLSYRKGAKRITSRLPVFELELESSDMFSLGADFEILLEAHTKKGETVGEAKSGGLVNPATGTVTLKPRTPVQLALRMHEDFEGKFTVKALDPTTLAVYCSLDLETDYTV
jgi:hypothetical protein